MALRHTGDYFAEAAGRPQATRRPDRGLGTEGLLGGLRCLGGIL